MVSSATASRSFIDRYAAPMLRQLGFRRRGSTFSRRYPDGWGMLAPVPSKWGTAQAAKVTFDIGVCLDVLRPFDEHLLWNDPAPLPLLYRDKHWTTALRELLPVRNEDWWPIRLDHLDGDAEFLLDLVRRYAIPELDRATSESGLLDRLLLPTNFASYKEEYYSVLLARAGRDPELEVYAAKVRSRRGAGPGDDDWLAQGVAKWDAHLARVAELKPAASVPGPGDGE